jgi:plastocyanin
MKRRFAVGYWLLAMDSSPTRLTRGTVAGLALVVWLGAGILAGCFSQHEATAPTEGACNVNVGGGVPGSTLIVVRGFAFTPSEVTVHVGDRVTWINCDQDQHTSTADGGQWSSPLISAGEAFTETFQIAGDFPYHCEPHPFMTGRVIVQ